MLSENISDEEFLYRGIIEKFWDYENNRPSSAIFKDSNGVSVDRSGGRSETKCVAFLNNKNQFFRVCSIQASKVRANNAVVLYKKLPDNIYHSEIHDSVERIRLRGKKPKNLRDQIFKIFF